MIQQHGNAEEDAVLLTAQVPRTFVEMPQRPHVGLDRQLGYLGKARYVTFYYEPRGEEVIWHDGGSSGFSCGGWCAFTDHIAPLAERHGFDVGRFRPAGGDPFRPPDVLMLDRLSGRAYFAGRAAATQFVSRQGDNEGPLA
jgi:hypothetical protein